MRTIVVIAVLMVFFTTVTLDNGLVPEPRFLRGLYTKFLP